MRIKTYALPAVFLALALNAYAQQPVQNVPGAAPKPIPLFFRETFKGGPAATEDVVFTTEHAMNPNLELKLYGPG